MENGELVIAEDEVEAVKIIFDRYIHTNEGINGVASYLNRNGYKKKVRQNGTIEGFAASFVKGVIDNPVYMGKIAYGRRKTEKKIGTRNEMHVVAQSKFSVYDGAHEAKATYDEIKKYVSEHNAGMKVSNLYISQVKRKCGIEVGKNLRVATRRMDCLQGNSTTAATDLELVPSPNLPKKEDSRQPQCPEDKERAIVEALEHFKMIQQE